MNNNQFTHTANTNMTGPSPLFPEILALHGKWRGNSNAVIFDGNTRTWREFLNKSNQVANALLDAGCRQGDVVAVLMQNGFEMAESLLGIALVGCVSAPLNLSVTDAAILAMIEDANAKVLIATADQMQRFAQEPGLKDLRLKVASEASETPPGWTRWIDWLRRQPTTTPAVKIQATDPLNIIYSSGTTGRPKGIVHTHQTRLDWAYDLSIALRYHGGAKTLCTLNLYSNIAWVQMMCTWLAGGTLVLTRGFDAGEVLRLIENTKITHTAMVPVQFQRILDHADIAKADLSSMQAMMSCGSPLYEELKAGIFDEFPCGIIELYGLTEGVITTLEPEEIEGRLASVGRPLMGTDLCILDDQDQICPIGEAGEIVSRGRIVMPGYHNRPDANAESIWVDEQGRIWLRTGDIGKLDEEGYLYIVDRKKDMILSGGQNIYPADIEAVLVEHPDVRDAAVIGIPSKTWGETPIAWIEWAEAGAGDKDHADPASIQQWLNTRVGKRQRIHGVFPIDELPRNPNGKILKRQLREMTNKPDES
jgi:acyl-CoA synthetase (AMP-forming)/AMP-acid ligase II